MTKNKLGRPPAITTKVVRKLDRRFREGFNVTDACKDAGISRDTYYAKCKVSKEFSDEMARAQMYPSRLMRQTIIRQVKEKKDGYLALRWLERKEPKEFSTRATTVHDGEVPIRDYGAEARAALDRIDKLKREGDQRKNGNP